MMKQWPSICSILRENLPPGTFKVWIDPLHGEVEAGQIKLTAPNAFVADWVKDRLCDDIERAAEVVLGLKPQVSIATAPAVINEPVASAPQVPFRIAHQAGTGFGATDTTRQTPLFSPDEQLGLPYTLPARTNSWRYNFDDFVVGPSNELAHAAARSMTRDTAATDVLFLNSASGLGKTHLSQSVGHSVCKSANRAQAKVEYLTAEEFASCFVQAMKARDIERFKNRFRELDLLLLEDVEFLQNKEKMQDEVLSTIKALQSRGSRVVLTSSFAPKELRNLDEQLVSRFCSGFLAGISRPDFETRRRILCDKAAAQDAPLPEGVSHLLAEQMTGDVRQLESCLCNLILKARLLGKEITADLAREVLAQYVESSPLGSLDDIVSKVCEGFGLSAPQLQSRSRRQNYVVARNTIFFLARRHTDLSLQEIGERFNRRHSTVIKGIAAIERELRRETPLGRQLAATLSRIEPS